MSPPYHRRGAATALVTGLLTVIACLAPSEPRALTDAELAGVTVEGRVSKWLPIRFSGEVTNDTTLRLESIELEIHGKRITKKVVVAPGESRRVSLQYLFPEDPGFGTIDPAAVEWRLAAAVGEPMP